MKSGGCPDLQATSHRPGISRTFGLRARSDVAFPENADRLPLGLEPAMRSNALRAQSVRPTFETLENRDCPSLFGVEHQVNTTVVNDQAESANASAGNGLRVVVWTDHSAGNANIKAQRYNVNGKVGAEITVADTPADEYEPDVAMDAAGNFVVVWTVDGPSRKDILGRRYSALRTKPSPFTPITFTVAGPPFARNWWPLWTTGAGGTGSLTT
jgi:hypothetical protein